MTKKKLNKFITEKLKAYLEKCEIAIPNGIEINPFAAPNDSSLENDRISFDRSTVFYRTYLHCVPFLVKQGIEIENKCLFSMEFTCYALGNDSKYGNLPSLQDKLEDRKSKLAGVLLYFDVLNGKEKSDFMNIPTNTIKRYKSQIEDFEQAIEVAEQFKLK